MMMSPLLSFRIPRCIEHAGIRLRPLRFLDGPLISRELNRGEISTTAGSGRVLSRSSLETWWWMKKTFPVLFCIEVESKCVGFIGMYNIEPGESSEVTLVVFESGERRRGYGSRAYAALASKLRPSSLARVIIARVKADNHPSLSFWKKLGFDELHTKDGIKSMATALGASRGESPLKEFLFVIE